MCGWVSGWVGVSNGRRMERYKKEDEEGEEQQRRSSEAGHRQAETGWHWARGTDEEGRE